MQRSVRVGDELRTVIADLIQNDIKDPRLPALVSVTEVRASRDLSHAHVYISVLGDDEARKNCAAALKSASGYLRREVAARVRLRLAPELHFVFDESIERGIRMSRLIDEAIGDKAIGDKAIGEKGVSEKGVSDEGISDSGIGDKAHE